MPGVENARPGQNGQPPPIRSCRHMGRNIEEGHEEHEEHEEHSPKRAEVASAWGSMADRLKYRDARSKDDWHPQPTGWHQEPVRVEPANASRSKLGMSGTKTIHTGGKPRRTMPGADATRSKQDGHSSTRPWSVKNREGIQRFIHGDEGYVSREIGIPERSWSDTAPPASNELSHRVMVDPKNRPQGRAWSHKGTRTEVAGELEEKCKALGHENHGLGQQVYLSGRGTPPVAIPPENPHLRPEEGQLTSDGCEARRTHDSLRERNACLTEGTMSQTGLRRSSSRGRKSSSKDVGQVDTKTMAPCPSAPPHGITKKRRFESVKSVESHHAEQCGACMSDISSRGDKEPTDHAIKATRCREYDVIKSAQGEGHSQNIALESQSTLTAVEPGGRFDGTDDFAWHQKVCTELQRTKHFEVEEGSGDHPVTAVGRDDKIYICREEAADRSGLDDTVFSLSEMGMGMGIENNLHGALPASDLGIRNGAAVEETLQDEMVSSTMQVAPRIRFPSSEIQQRERAARVIKRMLWERISRTRAPRPTDSTQLQQAVSHPSLPRSMQKISAESCRDDVPKTCREGLPGSCSIYVRCKRSEVS